MGVAAKSFLDSKTGAYSDSLKWSHLMVEADLELHRWTGEEYLLDRAKTDCAVHFAKWKAEPAKDLITNASLARQLWLMTDRENLRGQGILEEVRPAQEIGFYGFISPRSPIDPA